MRAAMVRFTALSLSGLLVLTLLSVPVASWIARSSAQREAEERTLAFARFVAAPLVDADVGAAPVDSSLAAAMDQRLRDESIVHAVLWGGDGRVLWADDPSAVGTVEPLDPDLVDLLGTTGAVSHYVSSIHAGGSSGGEEQVLEVYASAAGTDGTPFLLEWYWPTSQLAGTRTHVLQRLLPLTVGSLLLFQLLVLPLTLSTARRVDAERARLSRHALAVQQLERRRIGQDLHDGVVQDLSGLGYLIPTVRGQLPPGSAVRPLLDQAADAVTRDVADLRAMIADARMPALEGGRLSAALESLAARGRTHGLAVDLALSESVDDLQDPARSLVYRVVREGLRNAVRHSGAERVTVTVTIDRAQVRVSVVDDGAGPPTDVVDVPEFLTDAVPRTARGEEGDGEEGGQTLGEHVGLSLLRQTAKEHGGGLILRRHPSGGAQLLVTMDPGPVRRRWHRVGGRSDARPVDGPRSTQGRSG